jgi:hypothetical protein
MTTHGVIAPSAYSAKAEIPSQNSMSAFCHKETHALQHTRSQAVIFSQRSPRNARAARSAL